VQQQVTRRYLDGVVKSVGVADTDDAHGGTLA